MGHVRRKPATLAVVLRDIQALDGIRDPPSGTGPEVHQEHSSMSMKERCEASKQCATSAPGLKVALALALQDHLQRGVTPSLEAALRPLGQVALEGWRNHYLHDHTPARRDCKNCVKASARSKPHRRISHPESYTLSVDLSGKMIVGQDQSRHDCYTAGPLGRHRTHPRRPVKGIFRAQKHKGLRRRIRLAEGMWRRRQTAGTVAQAQRPH